MIMALDPKGQGRRVRKCQSGCPYVTYRLYRYSLDGVSIMLLTTALLESGYACVAVLEYLFNGQ